MNDLFNDFKEYFQEDIKQLENKINEAEKNNLKILKNNNTDLYKLKNKVDEFAINVKSEQKEQLNNMLIELLSFNGLTNEDLSIIFDKDISNVEASPFILSQIRQKFPQLKENLSKLVYEIPTPKDEQNVIPINYGHAGINFQKRLSKKQTDELKRRISQLFNLEVKHGKKGEKETVLSLSNTLNFITIESEENGKEVVEYTVLETILLGFTGFFSQTILYEHAMDILSEFARNKTNMEEIINRSYGNDDNCFKYGLNICKILINGVYNNTIPDGKNEGINYYSLQDKLKNKKKQRI